MIQIPQNQDDPDARAFWSNLRQRRLVFLRCEHCGAVVSYPRACCVVCGDDRLTEEQSSGEGVVYSYTVIRHALDPAYKGRTPYSVGLVDLNEGFRMLGHLDQTEGEIEIGQKVALRWNDDPEILPSFRPVREPAA